MAQSVVVSGCAGFVGSVVCEKLLLSGHLVYGIDDLSFGYEKNIPQGMNYFKGSITEIPDRLLNFCDILVCCSTSNIIYAQDNEIEVYRNNAIDTIKLFQRFNGKIIYTSTASVYNNAIIIPTQETHPVHTVNAYDTSKLIAEMFLQQRGNYTTLRLENVYGKNQRPENPYCGVVGKMICSILKGEKVTIYGDGLSTRSYSYVEDVARAIELATEQPAKNTEINIGSGKEMSAIDLAYLIGVVAEKEVSFNFVENRKIDTIRRRRLNCYLASELLGWHHTTELETGIKNTIQWMKKEYSL